MPCPAPFPPLLPQRVLVADAGSPAQAAAVARVAALLDLPLVLPSDRPHPDDLARLAAFDGWVAVLGAGEDPAALLRRAELVVEVQFDVPGTLRGLVRRTVRRIRADASPAPDLSWLDDLATARPDLAVARLSGAEEIERWLTDLGRSISG